MKRLILISILLAAAVTSAGVFQHFQLDKLRAYAQALESTNSTLAINASPQSAPTPTATSTATSIIAELADIDPADHKTAHAIYTGLATASPETLHAILGAIDGADLVDHVRDRLAMLTIINLVVHDAESAADASLDYIEQPGFLEHFMKTFAHNHPETAASWFARAETKNRIPSDLHANIDRKITAALAAKDPATALSLAEAASGQQRHDLLHSAARFVDSEQAWLTLVHTAAAHADPKFRATALSAISGGTGRNTNLDDTRHLIPQLDLPPDLKNRFISQAATRTIDDKTPERATWLIATSAPEYLHQNISSLVTTWTTRDFNATASWLSSIDPSPVRDTAIATFCANIAQREPASAAEWAITISDPAKKSATLDSIVANWQESAPTAAQAYLDSAAP